RSRRAVLLFVACLAVAAVPVRSRAAEEAKAPPAPAAKGDLDVTGMWEMRVGPPDHPYRAAIRLMRDGQAWKGTYSGGDGTTIPVTGTLEGSKLLIKATFEDGGVTKTQTIPFTVDGDTMSGAYRDSKGVDHPIVLRRANPTAASTEDAGPTG